MWRIIKLQESLKIKQGCFAKGSLPRGIYYNNYTQLIKHSQEVDYDKIFSVRKVINYDKLLIDLLNEKIHRLEIEKQTQRKEINKLKRKIREMEKHDI